MTLDDNGRCEAARVAVAGLSDGAQLAPAGGEALIGSDGGGGSVSDAMAAVAGSVETHSDHWADAAYRQQLIRGIGAEVAASAFQRARGGA